MKGFGEKNQSKKRNFPVENKKINTNKLINKAFELQAKGHKIESAKYYSYLIKKGIKDYRIFSNFGTFLKEIGKYEQAEIHLKKAIAINPN